MTSKQDFTDEEWTRIRRAPLVAGVAISLADPSEHASGSLHDWFGRTFGRGHWKRDR